jgi:hypothetical protein
MAVLWLTVFAFQLNKPAGMYATSLAKASSVPGITHTAILQHWSVRPCVRPLSAVHVTA